MEHDIYRRLQQKMHGYGPGFPASQSGVELKLLKRFFNEEEADLYVRMGPQPETTEMIANRIGEDVGKTAARLERMLEKGTVMCFDKAGRTIYSPAAYIFGIYESASNTMDVSLAELFEQYHKEIYFEHVAKTSKPAIKCVPVQEAIQSFTQVYPHDDVIALFKKKKKIAVIDCPCRKQLKLTGAPTRPIEVCMIFDELAEYFVDKRKQGRYLSLEEALEIQKQCDKAGLISKGGVLEDEKVMCHCDKDCITFRSFGTHDMPGDYIISNYYAEVDADACVGCGVCLERCPVETLSIGNDGTAEVNPNRCLGCGLCVTECPTGALSLKQKPDEKQFKKLLTQEEYFKILNLKESSIKT